MLIILATVVINLSLGQNGLFNKAKIASQEYKNAQDYEETQISKYNNEINGYVESDRNFNIKDLELDYDNKIDISEYTSKNNQFTVPSSGIIIVSGYITANSSMAFVYVNDIQICFVGGSNSSFYAGGGYSQIVTKNTKIYFNLMISDLYSAYFVPFK